MFLTVVCRQDRYLGGGVPAKPHVHVCRHNELRFAKVLKEMRRWHTFAGALEVPHVHKLKFVRKTGVGQAVLGCTHSSSTAAARCCRLCDCASDRW